MITINTNLGINETIEKLKTSKELARSLQLKIIVGSSDFKLCPSFLGTTVFFPLPSNSSSIKKALSPSILAPRTIIFCAHLKSSSSGTTITGHFRYSWLFRLFWPFFFAIATYFLWVNSGQQYPLAPLVPLALGIIMVLAVTIREPNFGWDASNVSQYVQTLFGTEIFIRE